MKNLIVIIIILALNLVASAGPEPAPWWQQREEIEGMLIKWIGTITIVGTALITAVGTLWVLLNNKIKEIKERQDRANTEKIALQTQVTSLAAQLPPPAPRMVSGEAHPGGWQANT